MEVISQTPQRVALMLFFLLMVAPMSMSSRRKVSGLFNTMEHRFLSFQVCVSLEIKTMIETLLASLVVGQVIIGPNLLQTQYLTEREEIITIVETIQEVR
jgi:hypothetical protein